MKDQERGSVGKLLIAGEVLRTLLERHGYKINLILYLIVTVCA
jgi:hypothetical protein